MLFKHCLFFIATALLTFSVAIPIPSGVRQPHNPADHGSASSTGKPSGLSRKQRKTLRMKAMAAKCEPTPPHPQKAIDRMERTRYLPNVDDQFSVGKRTFTGKMVRDAIANSLLRPICAYPRPYRNFPYPETHPDPSLRGEHPIPIPHNPHNPHKPMEYPLTPQKNGWRNNGDPGPARIVMLKDGIHDVFLGVVGHDPERGGDGNEHYPATHTKAKREVDEFEDE